jgi:uncharacterized protein (DUF2249 family)
MYVTFGVGTVIKLFGLAPDPNLFATGPTPIDGEDRYETMVSDIDVREMVPERAREAIVSALADLDPDEVVTVSANRNAEPALYQAQIKLDRVLTWTTEEAGPESWEYSVRVTEDETAGPVEFDVRDLPPQRRHEVLTETFEKLDQEEGFVLVNDHDPKPLYHELRSTHGDIVEWEYHSKESDAWKVEIGKTGASTTNGEDVAASFDVREIPKQERHPTIHHRFSNLSAGDVMEIIAPHEPRPLRQEFQQQYGDGFEWDIRENEHGRCRVWIAKTTTDGSERDGATAESEQSGDEVTAIEELDVREFPPAKRHELIFESYDELDDGEGFVLINDHDPKPLYHQFESEEGPEFHWEYQQREPGEFRVLIGKSDADKPPETPSTNFDAPF